LRQETDRKKERKRKKRERERDKVFYIAGYFGTNKHNFEFPIAH
jgi:hypothetical protein